MHILVFFNNGKTTLEHSAGPGGLTLKGGVDKLYAQYEIVSFRSNGANWWIEI